MKRNFTNVLLILLVLASHSYAVPIAHESNPHNMSSLATHPGPKAVAGVDGTDQICVFCHTPHSAAPQGPLWNRPEPTGPAGGFELYNQGVGLVIAANPGNSGYETGPDYPNGASRLCLSCHDGVTSVGVLLGNQTILMEEGGSPVTTLVEIDLATSHPISFTYDGAVIGLLGAYKQPDTPGVDTPLDAAGKMQCTTCHDPHEYNGVAGLPFWRNATYDEVCDNCHTGPTNASPPPIHNIPPP